MARKEKKYHFIYKTTNTVTGRYYYGMHSTDNLNDGYLGSGRRLRYSINKYGKDVHQREIVEFCQDRSLLKQREKDLIILNEIAKKDYMNLKVGGVGGFISDEQQRHRSSCAGKAHMKKFREDDEFRIKFCENQSLMCKDRWKNGVYDNVNHATFLNKKHSKETKEKMSESHKGKGMGKMNTQFGTCWVTDETTNRKIKLIELDYFIKNGWIRGRTFSR